MIVEMYFKVCDKISKLKSIFELISQEILFPKKNKEYIKTFIIAYIMEAKYLEVVESVN